MFHVSEWEHRELYSAPFQGEVRRSRIGDSHRRWLIRQNVTGRNDDKRKQHKFLRPLEVAKELDL